MPTAPRQRADEDRRLWRQFQHHSRTFSLATRLLPRVVRLPIATVYLYCRTVDSLADERLLEVGPAQARAELDHLRACLDATLAGRPPEGLLWQRLGEVTRAFGLPSAPLYELIEGAAWDLAGRGIDHLDDFVAYSELVAGSVGALVLPFLAGPGAQEPGAQEPAGGGSLEAPARALGIAMQITNILRDVGEDLRGLGRVYLPHSWMQLYGVAVADLARAELPPAGYAALVEALMEEAEARYAASEPSVAALSPSVRPGVRAAARLYREILNEVRANGYDNLRRRAVVPLPRKLRLLVQDDYTRRKRRLAARRGQLHPV